MKKLLQTTWCLVLMLLTLGTVRALAATVDIPTTVGSYINWSDAILSSCNTENNGANIGSTHNGSTATFTLNNVNKGDYVLQFKSGANGLTAVLNVTITNGTDEIVNEDVAISNTGSWSTTELHEINVTSMPAGTWTLTMTVKSTTGSYAGNYGNLCFISYDDYYTDYPQVPSDTYLPLQAGTYTAYTGPQYESSNQNIGYVQNGGKAEYTFYASQAAYYNLVMGITRFNEGTINAVITDVTSGVEECHQEFSVPNSSNYDTQTFEFSEAITSKGLKKLTLNFVCGNGYLLNYKDVTLAVREYYDNSGTKYTVTNSQNIAEAGTVSQSPSGTQIIENSNVKFTATPNFGYRFVKWVDGDNNDLSTDNPYTTQVKGDIAVEAIFEQINTYSLTVNVDGGYSNLITITPAPTIVNNKQMYEEGTEVTLTASENKAVAFNYWSDNTTAKKLVVTMDDNKEITATYQNNDYVVAWDFHKSSDGKSYKADYYSTAENNEASMYLRHAVTNEVNGRGFWLRGEDNYVTIWGIDNNLDAEGVAYSYEFHCNAKDFTDMSIEAELFRTYNYWQYVQPEYSFDGTNWTAFGDQIEITGARTVHNVALPAACDHQENLYVHFKPVLTSDVVGSSSDYRPLCIWNVYIFGTEEPYDDGVAPVFKASVPADNATGASATGRIVLTFDEKVKATDNFSATLNGTAISGTAAGKTFIFPYTGLSYDTQYTFALAAGSVSDPAGNTLQTPVQFSFRTMERTQPEARVFDAVVAQDGTGDYTTIGAALAAAPDERTKPWLIFIKEGDYEEKLTVTKPFMHLTGEGRSRVRIKWTENSGSADGATFIIAATDFFAEGITFEATYGYENLSGPQCLAIQTQKDRAIFNRIEARSYQDTYYSNFKDGDNSRAYFKDSWITGSVDFIYGSGNVYFDSDTLNINRPSGGWIVAPNHTAATEWGYVFQNTLITTTYTQNPEDSSISLGRPWHNEPKTVFLHTKMEVTPVDSLWSMWGAHPSIWAVYDLCDKNGNPRSTASRGYYDTNGAGDYTYCKNFLTDAEAAEYTIANVLHGTDAWLPELICEQTGAATVSGNGTTLTWPAVPYAISYVVLKNGKAWRFTEQNTCTVDESATYQVKAVSEYGVLSEASNAVIVLTTTPNMAGYKSFCDATTSYVADENTKVYYAKEVGSDKVVLATIDSREIPAGMPVILKTTTVAENPTENAYYQMTLTADANIQPVDLLNLLRVTDGTETFTTEGVYRLGYTSADGIRFYTWSPTEVTEGVVYLPKSTSSGAKLTIVFMGEDEEEVTGVTVVDADDAAAPAETYNALGQRVGANANGFVIVNGKKYVK